MDTTNKRYLQVEEKIVDAFNKLMQEKGLKSIKVSDIIRESGINRCSFYTHYRDINDLVEKAEQSILDEMINIIRTAPPMTNPKEKPSTEMVTEHARRIVYYFYENGRKLALYAGEKGDPTFITKIQTVIAEIWNENPMNDSLKVPSEYALAGIGGMMSGLFGRWLMNDFRETPEEFLEISKTIVQNIPESIIDRGEDDEDK